MVKTLRGKGIGGHRTRDKEKYYEGANHPLRMYHLFHNRSPPESFFQGREAAARNNGANTIKRLFKNIIATKEPMINLDSRKNQRNIVQSNLPLQHPLPKYLYQNIAEFAGKGVKSHLIKHSPAAKKNMAWVRTHKK